MIRIELGKALRVELEDFYQIGEMGIQVRDEDVFFVVGDVHGISGAVRFCVENEVPLLRSMLVRKDLRKSGIGKRLLQSYEQYILEHKIQLTHLVCPSRLENFYGRIGFQKMDEKQGPGFLYERVLQYREKNPHIIMMRRG